MRDEFQIPEAIYVSTRNVPKTKTRKGFLRKYYEEGAPATYHDEELSRIQTPGGKNRSVTDLVALVRSRFKKTSINATLRILRELQQDGALHLVWCTKINKVVVRRASSSTFVSGYSRRNYLNTEGRDGLSLAKAYAIATEETGTEDSL